MSWKRWFSPLDQSEDSFWANLVSRTSITVYTVYVELYGGLLA